MWWAYVELGWGGYWAWDPVENASLMPWLAMTAFLHSVMIQEKRGMLKKWNIGLIIGAFLLSIFGTFLTRSGVISSVHSFAQSNVGWFFLVFLVGAGLASFTLLSYRWPQLAAEANLESMVSREAAFLFNNLIFVVITFSVFWGTIFPVLSEWVRGTKVTVGPPFFNLVNIPLGLLLLLLTGIGPLIAWRKASTANLRRQFVWPVAGMLVTAAALALVRMSDGWALVAYALAAFVTVTVAQEFVRGSAARHRQYHEAWPLAVVRLVGRNRRRYGGYVVHLGMVMLFAGFAGLAFKRESEVTLKPGQSAEIRSPYGHVYRVTHQGVSQYEQLEPLRHRGEPRRLQGREVRRGDEEREAAAHGLDGAADLRALDGGGDPQRPAGGPVRGVRGVGAGDGGGGVPPDDQPAGVVGVVRRAGPGHRRADLDVAHRTRPEGRGAAPAAGGGVCRTRRGVASSRRWPRSS